MSTSDSFDSSLLEKYYNKGYACVLYNNDNHNDHKTYYEFSRAVEDTIYYEEKGITYKLINTEEYKKRSE